MRAGRSHWGSRERASSLDAVLDLAIAVGERGADRDDVVLGDHAHRRRDRGVEAQGLVNDHVQVRQRVELVHGGVVRLDGQKLVAKLLLHVRRLRERVEAPRRRGARRLVPSDEERRDLCERLFLSAKC